MEIIKKLGFRLHDDISGTGSRIGINERGFWKAKFHLSNDRSPIDKKSLSSELQRFKVFLILTIELND